jgi:cytoskeletal protein RodZ
VANETTIGAKLRQARLDKHISLDELQQMTKVQKRYLEAIEADRFEQLPGTFYVRAFIRQFAAAVGEDGDRLVAVFDGKETLAAPLPKRPKPETVSGSRKAMHVDEDQSFVSRYLPMILLGLVAITIICIVGYMAWQDRNSTPMIQGSSTPVVENSVYSTTSSTETESTESQETSESETQATSSSESSEEMTMTKEESSQSDITIAVKNATTPVELELTGLDASCWVGILVDNAYVYQYTVQAGEVQSTTLPENATNATIVLGASQNIQITANGQKVDFDDPQYKLLQKNVHLTIDYQETN